MGLPELILLVLMLVIPLGLGLWIVRSVQKAAASREPSRVAQLEQRVAELEAQQNNQQKSQQKQGP